MCIVPSSSLLRCGKKSCTINGRKGNSIKLPIKITHSDIDIKVLVHVYYDLLTELVNKQHGPDNYDLEECHTTTCTAAKWTEMAHFCAGKWGGAWLRGHTVQSVCSDNSTTTQRGAV